MIRKLLLYVLLAGMLSAARAQQTGYAYWLELKDKDTATFSLSKPLSFLGQQALERRSRLGVNVSFSDVPVNPSYIKALQDKGFEVLVKSRWLNAITVLSTTRFAEDSFPMPGFAKNVRYLGEKRMEDRSGVNRKTDLNEKLSSLEARFNEAGPADTNVYGKAAPQINMLNLRALHNGGYRGNGIFIAVIDAGFKNADRLGWFRPLFQQPSRVKYTYDIVDAEDNVYNDDDHGVAVLSCMAADKPHEYVGTAPDASFALMRTENTTSEFPVEEAMWIAAVEFADSAGVDLVSSSLGYNLFDDHGLDHHKKQLDGKSTLISSAAGLAAGKGLLIVNSAGNEGDNAWRQLGFPADADGILSVGSVDISGRHSPFSSVGPSSDRRIKPEITALGENVYVVSSGGALYQGNGTSYSCPIVSGAVACLMQHYRQANPSMIIGTLRLSASTYYQPTAENGYGVPDFAMADALLGCALAQPHDTVVDARWLDNGLLHIAGCAGDAQRVKADVLNEAGKLVLSGNVRIKGKGNFRAALDKSDKLLPGIYTLRVTMSNKAIVLPLRKG